MAPRKKNLKRRETFKVPYAVLYTHDTAEGKPKKEATAPSPAGEPADVAAKPTLGKPVPAFAKKK